MSPASAWETEEGTVKKLKAQERKEPLAFYTPDFVSMVIVSFPGLGRVPPSLSLLVETAADNGATSTARGSMGWEQVQVSAAQSPHFRMMW